MLNNSKDMWLVNEVRSHQGFVLKMEPLGWWLLLVAVARISSVYFGFFNLWALQVGVYSKANSKLMLAKPKSRYSFLIAVTTCIIVFPFSFRSDSCPW